MPQDLERPTLDYRLTISAAGQDPRAFIRGLDDLRARLAAHIDSAPRIFAGETLRARSGPVALDLAIAPADDTAHRLRRAEAENRRLTIENDQMSIDLAAVALDRAESEQPESEAP